jgi:KUP system potassium uptake protein
LVEKICAIEQQMNPRVSEAFIEEIRSAVETTTHMWVSLICDLESFSSDFPSAPHYYVVSRKVHVGFLSPVVNYLRSFLIEGIYRRLGRFFGFVDFVCADGLFTANMFPETANWLTPADEYVFIPITCIPKLMSRQNYPRRYQRRYLMFERV